MEEKRYCLECKELLKGRTDQKFCSDYCRNAYNNRKRTGHKQLVRRIDKILHNNRNVLCELCPQGKKTIFKFDLASAGFDFNYFTNIYRTKKDVVYYFCYDYGFSYLKEKDKILIVKKEEYI